MHYFSLITKSYSRDRANLVRTNMFPLVFKSQYLILISMTIFKLALVFTGQTYFTVSDYFYVVTNSLPSAGFEAYVYFWKFLFSDYLYQLCMRFLLWRSLFYKDPSNNDFFLLPSNNMVMWKYQNWLILSSPFLLWIHINK